MYHLRRKLHFVVMRSVVDTACKIHTMYVTTFAPNCLVHARECALESSSSYDRLPLILSCFLSFASILLLAYIDEHIRLLNFERSHHPCYGFHSCLLLLLLVFRYDLKGSLVGRQASHKDRETGGVLKDQDLLSDGMKFHLGERRGHLFCKVAAADAAFLSELKIMDYSLLVRELGV
jgi:hypothetical protein